MLTNKIGVFTLIVSLSLIFSSPVHAQSNWLNTQCVGQRNGIDDDIATIKGFECVFQNIIAYAISFIGLAVFVMLIVGAFRLLLSSGDTKNVEEGKQIVTNALLGLILAISAWFILNLIAQFTGATNILIFNIPS